MHLSRNIRALMTACLIIGLTVPARADASLDALVQKIVAATTTGANLDGSYEPELAKRIAEMSKPDASDMIEFDWVTDSQDPDFDSIKKSILTKVAETKDGEAKLSVTFKQYDIDTFAIDYTLKKAGDGWLIWDVVYPNGNFALRKAAGLAP